MAVIDEARASGAPADVLVERPARPVLWWAAAGAAVIALQAYVYVAWVVSGDATRTPTGEDPVGGAVKAWALVHQVLLPVGAVLFVAWVVRRCVRERRLTFDALLVIAWVACFWQDPMLNYVRTQFFYNSYLVNLGSWVEHIPGWVSPNGRLLPEPLLFTGVIYVWVTPILSIMACNLMRLAKRRRPALGAFGLLAVAYGSMVVMDFVLEAFWVRTELYAFPGAIHSLSLFGGERYQFPLYESFIWAGVLTSMGALRYFRDDRGRSVVERGVDRVRASTRQRTGLRALAVVGFANVAMFCIYNVPINYFNLHAGRTPEGYPSYLKNGMCGEGTDYECPGPEVHLPLPESGPIPPRSGRN